MLETQRVKVLDKITLRVHGLLGNLMHLELRFNTKTTHTWLEDLSKLENINQSAIHKLNWALRIKVVKAWVYLPKLALEKD